MLGKFLQSFNLDLQEIEVAPKAASSLPDCPEVVRLNERRYLAFHLRLHIPEKTQGVAAEVLIPSLLSQFTTAIAAAWLCSIVYHSFFETDSTEGVVATVGFDFTYESLPKLNPRGQHCSSTSIIKLSQSLIKGASLNGNSSNTE